MDGCSGPLHGGQGQRDRRERGRGWRPGGGPGGRHQRAHRAAVAAGPDLRDRLEVVAAAEGAAVGTAAHCADQLMSYLDAGADEILLHGAAPKDMGPLTTELKRALSAKGF